MKRGLATSLSVVTFALSIFVLVQLPAGEATRPGGQPGAVVLLFGLLAMTFSVAGLLIARRLPRNPVGWSFLVVGLIFAVGLSFEQYARSAYEGGDRGGLVTALAWIADTAFNSPAVFAPFLFFFYFFPTGRLPSRSWRWLLRVGVVSGGVLLIDFALRPENLLAIPVENPLGIEAMEPFRFALNLAFIPLVISLMGSVASLVVRFRRAHGIERLQIKWFLTASGVFVVTVAIAPVLLWPPTTPQWIWPIALFVSLALIPTSAAIAIFRYRLYEIDFVINRTLVYGILTAILAGAYVGLVFALQALLAPVTAESDLAIAASTLAVAALFRPLRSRVQAFIDHRFYRRKFDAQRTLEDFGGHLRDEVDLTALSSRLTGVVAETMQPAHVSLWLRGPGSLHPVTISER